MQNRSFLGSIPPVTLNLIIVNFIVWLAALTLPKIAGINLNYWLGLHYFAADDFNVVQLITYMFLHDTSGIEHIFFNMFSVFMFGRTLEAVWGGKRFLFYYITTGMGAALVQEAAWYFELRSAISETVALYGWEQTSQLLNNFITVGASGAAFGILLASACYSRMLRCSSYSYPFPSRQNTLSSFTGYSNYSSVSAEA